VDALPTHLEPPASSPHIFSSSASSGANQPVGTSSAAPTAPKMLQIALEKFKAPTVGFAPQANTVWLDALRRVVTDVKRLRCQA